MERKRVFCYLVLSILAFFLLMIAVRKPLAKDRGIADATPGSLSASSKSGQSLGLCPLVHTEVKAEITGAISRVTMRQQFQNPFSEPIEAVYTFPLPHNAAVDDMTIHAGNRTIRGIIKRREEAKEIYEAAKARGQMAGLLDQERPNIFTQQVANIMPGQGVDIVLSYVETLKYEKGGYSFIFPTVVGPRYIPGVPVGKQGGGWAPDTTKVPDASRITPIVTPPGTRSGHDLSIEVRIDSGVPMSNIRSATHAISMPVHNSRTALVRLADIATIPNKDFILSYDVAGAKMEDGLVFHRMSGDGYFMLILQPPNIVRPEQVVPKELVFVLDTSGSMQGFPIEKAKETMMMALDGLYPHDTFNLITFSGNTRILFPQPVPATQENLELARQVLKGSYGSGGTEMMRAIRAALTPSDNQGHVRIVCFMTDGFVGNDMEIISEVQKHPNARIFSFGIGSSVNRFLLDKIAEEGRGSAEYVGLEGDATAAAIRFHERIRNPLLTDITLEWSGTPVSDIYPRRIPDLFSAEPVVLCGRYSRGGSAMVRLRGVSGSTDYVRDIQIPLPEKEPQHFVLSKLWARSKIDALMAEDLGGVQRGTMRPELKEAIVNLGLAHGLMTQFTSFVAVEERISNEGGKPKTIQVPVEMPEGVSYRGVFGDSKDKSVSVHMTSSLGMGGGMGGGMGAVAHKGSAAYNVQAGGVSGGVSSAITGGLVAMPQSAPPSPPPVVKREALRGLNPGARLIHRVEPVYPELAKRMRLSGSVVLKIEVDEAGNVRNAQVVSGPLMLRDAAVNAVRQWKYSPAILDGNPVSVIATETLNFSPDGLSINSRLDPAIAQIIERMKAGQSAGSETFIKEGKAELDLLVSKPTEELKIQLRSIGFEVVSWPEKSTTVVGRMPVTKLEALLKIESVQRIVPHIQ
jgi:Ca-activated chloride channel homolog